MVKNNEDFSSFDLTKLLRQPQTQALLARLQQLNNDALQQAVRMARSGDTEGAKAILFPLLQDRQVQDLASQMRENNGGI